MRSSARRGPVVRAGKLIKYSTCRSWETPCDRRTQIIHTAPLPSRHDRWSTLDRSMLRWCPTRGRCVPLGPGTCAYPARRRLWAPLVQPNGPVRVAGGCVTRCNSMGLHHTGGIPIECDSGKHVARAGGGERCSALGTGGVVLRRINLT